MSSPKNILDTYPIAITTGSHRGIGAEVIAKGLYSIRNSVIKDHHFVIFGIPELYRPYKKFLPKNWAIWTEAEVFNQAWKGPKRGHLNFIVPHLNHIEANRKDAFSIGRYIELAVHGAQNKKFSSIVTGPIEKSELIAGGFAYSGHTEMLQKLCNTPTVTMMLASAKMKVSLVTTHIALKDVSSTLTTEKINSTIENTYFGLQKFFGLKNPRIAVLGLNPHAGDQELFGNEERLKISPSITRCKTMLKNCIIEGPFSSDGFFALWQKKYSKQFDAIVCMYHDQGLIPLKLLDFDNAVNITLGLPIIRTSVDHGVGLDIAGKNIANPKSLTAALKLAISASKRNKKMFLGESNEI